MKLEVVQAFGPAYYNYTIEFACPICKSVYIRETEVLEEAIKTVFLLRGVSTAILTTLIS